MGAVRLEIKKEEEKERYFRDGICTRVK